MHGISCSQFSGYTLIFKYILLYMITYPSSSHRLLSIFLHFLTSPKLNWARAGFNVAQTLIIRCECRYRIYLQWSKVGLKLCCLHTNTQCWPSWKKVWNSSHWIEMIPTPKQSWSKPKVLCINSKYKQLLIFIVCTK